MEYFDYWQDAMDNLQADNVERMCKLMEKYGTDPNPAEMSFADEIEYNMVKDYKDAALSAFYRR